jgi:ribosomal protein S27E
MAMIHFTNSAAAVQKSLTRECPSCHEKQLVAMSKMRESVACKKCGASIGPKGRVTDK